MAKKATTLHDNLGNDLLPVTNASITFMDDGNSVQAEINDLKEKTRYNKGHFSTPEALNLAYPSTNPDGSIISDADSKLREGWYAIVVSTDTVWIWDVEGKEWVNSGSTTGAVESVNGLNGEVILTGGNINATATINETSKTELINKHLTDIYSELNNKEDEIENIRNNYVTNNAFSQELQNVKDMIPTDNSELTNGANYATEQYVQQNGGKIDTISVNGIQQDIINKNVDISIPTDNNQLSNGAGYQTANDVNTLISNATQDMLTTSNYPSTLDSVYQKVGDYATITDLETKQDQLTSTQLQAVNSGANTTNINQITTNSNNINTINSKIPNQASSTNQLADKDFVNSSLNSITAFYITSNSNGDPFPTKSALINATTYYSGGEVRTPTRNDYAIILQDESEENATTRYIYYNQWEYQYTVNETPLTADQLSAINSGITSTLVGKISSNEANINSISNELSTNYAKKSELNNYLPKTGGTLTATSGDTALSVQSKSTASYIGFKDSNGSLLGYYGVNSSKKPVFYSGGDKVLAYASDIPTKTSQLTNDSGFSTFSGSYNDLTNKPTSLPTPNYLRFFFGDSPSTTWAYRFNGSSTVDAILSVVAGTGDYNDLLNKPITGTISLSNLSNTIDYTNFNPSNFVSIINNISIDHSSNDYGIYIVNILASASSGIPIGEEPPVIASYILNDRTNGIQTIYAEGYIFTRDTTASQTFTYKKIITDEDEIYQFANEEYNKSINLLNLPDVSETTINGINYKVENGVITLNGTVTGSYFNLPLPISLNNLIGEYSINVFYNTENVVFTGIAKNEWDNSYEVTSNGTRTYNLSGDTFIYYRIYLKPDVTVSNLILKPMLVKGTTAPTQFIPYNGSIVHEKDLLTKIYPVGSIYMSVNSTSPASFLGGTWEQLKDRFLLGAGDSYSAGSTGGEASHTLTVNEMPSHTHDIMNNNHQGSAHSENRDYVSQAGWGDTYRDWGNFINYTGGNQAHNNMPPYLSVYMFKRVS